VSDDWVDRIGHGTAVAAAIREKAPTADLYAVRIFGDRLAARASTLVAGIGWAVDAGATVVNLSLGTTNARHRPLFEAAIERATRAGALVVAARDEEGMEWLPGSLPGVVGVEVDWTCARDRLRVVERGGVLVFRASGFARPVPGVDPRRNLHGVSFAVANVSGFLARALTLAAAMTPAQAIQRLEQFARTPDDQVRPATLPHALKTKGRRREPVPAPARSATND
jgi:subtilisin family serine protease